MFDLTKPIQTMSSREIADLVESRHDSVKRSMETLQDKGVISFTQSVETSHDGAGARPVEVYLVGKRDSYVVVAQLSPEFTARLVDRIANGEGSMCLQSVAKHLQVQPKKFFSWMQERRRIYRRPGGSGYLGYQDQIQTGYLEHKVTTIERSDGSTKVVEQVRVTPKGLAKFALELGRN